jgi:NAD-dependent dihydropyrimidine dehydrogenase PreA subunit
MTRCLYLKNVVTLQAFPERCTGCGTCLDVCPQAVLALENRRVTLRHRDACMECGACARNCPEAALTVTVGVGCAAAVINDALGRSGACCCTTRPGEHPPASGSACC